MYLSFWSVDHSFVGELSSAGSGQVDYLIVVEVKKYNYKYMVTAH